MRVKGDVKMVMAMVMTGDGVLGWISNIYFPPCDHARPVSLLTRRLQPEPNFLSLY